MIALNRYCVPGLLPRIVLLVGEPARKPGMQAQIDRDRMRVF